MSLVSFRSSGVANIVIDVTAIFHDVMPYPVAIRCCIVPTFGDTGPVASRSSLMPAGGLHVSVFMNIARSARVALLGAGLLSTDGFATATPLHARSCTVIAVAYVLRMMIALVE